MCGIAGLIGLAPDPARIHRVETMLDSLAHRGPDGRGLVAIGRAVLGTTRLAMRGIDDGKQPMTSADGRYTLVYNGELYNDRELRQSGELAGYCVDSSSDTATVLAAWQRYGPRCVEHLSGMFSFFVWDSHADRGFLVRDRLGVKPLFIARLANGELGFASEIKALLGLLDGRPSADLERVSEYLLAPCLSHRSPIREIDELEPGHWGRS